MQDMDIQHDNLTGAIIPSKLYGFGIAFPEQIIDPEYGHAEHSIGMVTFMQYARRVLPAQGLCDPMPPGSPASDHSGMSKLLQGAMQNGTPKANGISSCH